MKRGSAGSAPRQGGSEHLVATRFKVRVPPNRRVVLAVPAEVEPGEAEVIVLHQRAKPSRGKGAQSKSRQHPAFGLWASRPETADPVEFVNELRRRMIERRLGVRKPR